MGSYITVDTPEGSFKAYLARPVAALAPAVVVIQEILGVNADLRATCDELAAQGYLALSPDLFWRMEPGVDLPDGNEAVWKKAFALYNAFDYDLGVADIQRTMLVARTLPGSNGKVGLMGYCLGGLMTFLVTARTGSNASVFYYGGGTEKHLAEAKGIASPLLMHMGEEDEYIPREARTAIIAAVKDNPLVQVYTYPGCRHAFARHMGAHYDRDAATLANTRTAQFLKANLG
jgi:carboxymethylenebutenolidase